MTLSFFRLTHRLPLATALLCISSVTFAQTTPLTEPNQTATHAIPATELHAFIAKAAPLTGWTSQELATILTSAEYKQRIIDLMNKPGEAMPWPTYRSRIVSTERIAAGVTFITTYQDVLARAETTYGVPREIIAAIIGVETSYGKNKGSYRVIDALSTLGFNYPRRSEFFQKELIAFLALAKKSNIDPLATTGSYAGAIGWPQFMPSSARKLAVDFDGDGVIDLVNSPADAIGSVANYFKANDWTQGGPLVSRVQTGGNLSMPGENGTTEAYQVSHNYDVIKRYNHSNLYAMAVFDISEYLRQSRKP